MIAPRLMPRSEWERRLRSEHNCSPYTGEGVTGLTTGEFWITEHKALFVVPCDAAGLLRLDDWQQVVVRIAGLRTLDIDD